MKYVPGNSFAVFVGRSLRTRSSALNAHRVTTAPFSSSKLLIIEELDTDGKGRKFRGRGILSLPRSPESQETAWGMRPDSLGLEAGTIREIIKSQKQEVQNEASNCCVGWGGTLGGWLLGNLRNGKQSPGADFCRPYPASCALNLPDFKPWFLPP